MRRPLFAVSLAIIGVVGACSYPPQSEALETLESTLAAAGELIQEASGESPPEPWLVETYPSDWCLQCSISSASHELGSEYGDDQLAEFVVAAGVLGLSAEQVAPDLVTVKGRDIYPISIWWSVLTHRIVVSTGTGAYLDPSLTD